MHVGHAHPGASFDSDFDFESEVFRGEAEERGREEGATGSVFSRLLDGDTFFRVLGFDGPAVAVVLSDL